MHPPSLASQTENLARPLSHLPCTIGTAVPRLDRLRDDLCGRLGCEPSQSVNSSSASDSSERQLRHNRQALPRPARKKRDILLFSRMSPMSGRQDLNLRPLAPQASALAWLRHAPSWVESEALDLGTSIADRGARFNCGGCRLSVVSGEGKRRPRAYWQPTTDN